MAARKTARSRQTQTRGPRSRRRWSAEVTRRSDALDLESRVFTKTPRQIAASLMRSARRSRRRKAGPYQSAMSMRLRPRLTTRAKSPTDHQEPSASGLS
jgi:hypothetical protein